jgi:pimeloyl-ACP methyl ester carboxylesterase
MLTAEGQKEAAVPYCVSRGARIHYRVEGHPDGPPLVLQHGFSMSLRDWYEQGYVAALGGAYRLILVDARGHGASDKPHDPDAYRARLRVADVLAVLDDLGIERAHFFGYSMGARIGFALATHAPGRFRSLIFGGGDPADQNPAEPDAAAHLLARGAGAWTAAMEPVFGARMTPVLRARQMGNDARALLARTTSADAERPGYEETLPRVTVPCLFIAGDADQPRHDRSKAVSARVPRASFVSVPGLDHIEGVYRVDLVAPYVLAFLASVESGADAASANQSA